MEDGKEEAFEIGNAENLRNYEEGSENKWHIKDPI